MTVAYLHRHCRVTERLAIKCGPGTVWVRGEIDAANARDFAAAVRDASVDTPELSLDLTEVDFMAVDGVTALHAINADRTRAGTSWTVVPGSAVRRLLQLCDPEGLIPVTGCVGAADEDELTAAEPA